MIRGKTQAVRMAVIGMLAGGHILFEDVPGMRLEQLSVRAASLVTHVRYRVVHDVD